MQQNKYKSKLLDLLLFDVKLFKELKDADLLKLLLLHLEGFFSTTTPFFKLEGNGLNIFEGKFVLLLS